MFLRLISICTARVYRMRQYSREIYSMKYNKYITEEYTVCGYSPRFKKKNQEIKELCLRELLMHPIYVMLFK